MVSIVNYVYEFIHFSYRKAGGVWLVASEHIYNMTNIGLNIHSDMLCDFSRRKTG